MSLDPFSPELRTQKILQIFGLSSGKGVTNIISFNITRKRAIYLNPAAPPKNMKAEIRADTLDVLAEYYTRIMGHHPGVADKSLLRRYAQTYEFVPFEFQTVVESFLQEYHPNPRKLSDVPIELW